MTDTPNETPPGSGRLPDASCSAAVESPLDWSIRQLAEMIAIEKDPSMKAIWLRASAIAYERKAKEPPNDPSSPTP